MKILVLAPEYIGYGGGIMVYYRKLLPALVSLGHSVRVIVGSQWTMSNSSRPVEIDGVLVESLEDRRFQHAMADLQFLAAAPVFRRHLAAALAVHRQAMQGARFDVVEATDFGLLALGPLMEKSVPVLMQMHGSVGQIGCRDPQPGEAVDDALCLATEIELARNCHVVASSHGNAEYWRNQGAQSLEVSYPAWSRELRSDSNSVNSAMLVVGRIQRWKGPDVLCNALRLIGANCPKIEWYGRDTSSGTEDGTTSARLAREYSDIWGKKVIPMPPVHSNQIVTLQSRALVNVIPSSWDVFNFTVVEALASGRPVVCSDGAGAAELIEDGVSGFVFKSGDAVSLAAALERALSLPAGRVELMAEAARTVIKRNLAPANAAQRRVDSYEKAISLQTGVLSDWLREICRPSILRPGTELEYLKNTATRDLTRYIGKRITNRIRGF